MKKFSVLTLAVFAGMLSAQDSADAQSIKDMCGCYEVKFNFAETFNYPKNIENYKPSAVKHDVGLEWVQLVEDSPKKKMLQHLLIAGPDMIIKHWRQDWLYENTQLLDYAGNNVWNAVTLPKDQVRGQWTQKVFQVDDSPRYEASASWIHKDGRDFWEGFANAPLPRREHTVRNDYNVLKRKNVHEIIKEGWIHDQDNDKIIKTADQKDVLLAQEKGTDVYKKVEDAKCNAAIQWWKANEVLWAKVRSKWDTELGKNKNITLKESINGKPLFTILFALKPTASQSEVDTIIDSFIVK